MSETTTDRALWCPMTGHPMVYEWEDQWMVGCDECGFGAHGDYFSDRADAVTYARRLIRAELARQEADYYRRAVESRYSPAACRSDTMIRYEWLGAHPLRLPGEGA